MLPGHCQNDAGDFKLSIIHFTDKTWKILNRPCSLLHFPSISSSHYRSIQSNLQVENALAQFNANSTMLSIITDINEHRANITNDIVIVQLVEFLKEELCQQVH